MLPPPTPAQALPDDILEEIFLRLPPDEPASLVRVSLVSKPWLSLLSGPSFHGRYREVHGAPPMLGFLYSWPPGLAPIFVSTTKFGAHNPYDKNSDVLDCRHGRVLLRDKDAEPMTLVVWDPMTGCRRHLNAPKDYHCYAQMAAVLCAVIGCDHRACHEGPFQVVLVTLDDSQGHRVAKVYTSLPEVVEWDMQCSDHHLLAEWTDPCCSLDLEPHYTFIESTAPVFSEGALYFMLWNDDYNQREILRYDMSSNLLSLLDVPPVGVVDIGGSPILMAMEDGCLGLAYLDGLTLNLWSGLISSDRVVTWIQRRIIDLKKVLILNPKQTVRLIGSVEGSDIIFVITDLGIYEINLKSLRRKKIWRKERLCNLIPYMSFYNPRERMSSTDAA